MKKKRSNRKKNSLVSVPSNGSQSIEIPYIEIDSRGANSYDDEIHLREYLERVRRHKWIVVIVTLFLMTAAVYFILTQPKVYVAEAQIQVDTESMLAVDGGTARSTFEDRAYYNTQLELLENPEIIRTVISKHNLENDSAFLDENFINKESLQSVKSKNEPTLSANKAEKDPDDVRDQQMAEAERLQPLVKAIRESLNVRPVLQNKQTVKDTKLISIKFRHPDPGVTKAVSNGIADELVLVNLDGKLKTNSGERVYLKKNIADLEAQIRRDEQKILQFGANFQLPTQDKSQNTVVERLTGLNRQLLEAENERKQAEAAYKAALAPGVAEAVAETNAAQITEIDAKLDDLRQKRAQLLVEATEKHPDVLEMDKQITVLENSAKNKRSRATLNYKTGLEARYRQAVAREEAIRKSYDNQWGKTLAQNGAAINYRIIQESLDTNRKILSEMQQREKKTAMLKAKTPNNIRVVDYALTPTEPEDQKRLPYLGLAFVFSFSLGIGGALLRDYLDDSVHTADEVEKTLSVPAIGSIPQVKNGIFNPRQTLLSSSYLTLEDAGEVLSLSDETGNELIINSDGFTPLAEAFHQLRTVLLTSPDADDVKTLLVTSSRKGEGKTTTSINIATSLAQNGASVLIIDADLRAPRLHKIFNLPNERGLSTLLTEEISSSNLEELLIEKKVNLHILTSGEIPYDCSEYLGPNRMGKLLEVLEPLFDYIVIDSPPVTVFADSAVMASIVDGVLLVVQQNKNSTEILKQTRKSLVMVGANIVGVVLNKVNISAEQSDYRSYYTQ